MATRPSNESQGRPEPGQILIVIRKLALISLLAAIELREDRRTNTSFAGNISYSKSSVTMLMFTTTR
jgi:hypothetical protein